MEPPRRESSSTQRGAAGRVLRSHAQTRTTLRFSLAFVVAAPLAAAIARDWWLPLHLFLAGAVVLAISAVSLMLTVTWSAAPAPTDLAVAAQRSCIAVGAAGVGIGREAGLAAWGVGLFGFVHVAGLVLLVLLLVTTIRRGVTRRFDVAVAGYVVAICAGLCGVGLGVYMSIAGASPDLRAAHMTLNLLGLVGLVVGSTLPFFAATVGRTKMWPGAGARRLTVTLVWQSSMVAMAAVGLAIGAQVLAALGFAGYGSGVVAVLSSLPRPARRQWRWAGPRLAALWLGGAWWAIAVLVAAADAARGAVLFDHRWLVVMVISGYGQILWGSLAYLLPMLRGGGAAHLSDGFAATRSWLGLGAVNVVGLAAATGLPSAVALIAGAVWLIDAAWRTARVGTSPAPRPDNAGSTGTV